MTRKATNSHEGIVTVVTEEGCLKTKYDSWIPLIQLSPKTSRLFKIAVIGANI